MSRSLLLLTIVGLLATVPLACSGSDGNSGEPRVVTTVYPVSFVMDRIMDKVARETGVDRAEVRLRNFIPPDEFPYPQPTGRYSEFRP